MNKKSLFIFFLFLVSASIGKRLPDNWISGIAVLSSPAGLDEAVRSIQRLPQPYRRRQAIELFKKINSESIEEFEKDIYVSSIAGDVLIEKGYWLGNAVKIKFSKREVLQHIKNLSCVVNAFEDFAGFHIMDACEPADALDTAWGIEKINAPTCWSWGYEGQNIIVAVLDTGTRYTHLDLVENMWHNELEIPENGLDDDGNGFIDDYYGYDTYYGDSDPWDNNGPIYHGTHCSGTVAGNGSAGTNTGVAPSAKIMAVKVMSSSGSGTADALATGIEYALENGADIMSLSIGWENPSDEIKNFMRPLMEDVLTAGVVAAVAAGNEAGLYYAPQDITSPGDCPSPLPRAGEGNERSAVITVGATDSGDNIADFSSYGPTHWYTGTYYDYPYPPGLLKPDVSAPGVNIKSTYGSSDIGYFVNSGTSMATPHVAGALAVLLSKNPVMTPRQLDSLLQATALELGPAGKDSLYGSGRIRLDEAILAVPTPSFPVISYYSHEIDDASGNDNGIADLGESINLPVTLRNSGITATGISATISESSSYITILDDAGSYPNIATGETGTNYSDLFTLQISPGTPPGHTFDVTMHIVADGTYFWDDTFTVTVADYPRQTMDVNAGAATFTITNFGELGFYDPASSGSPGSGFIYSGYNYLFGGSIFIGFGYDDVSTGEGGNGSEIKPVSAIQESAPGIFADHEMQCQFVDNNTRTIIDLLAMAWNSSPDNDFVILRYIVDNLTSSSLTNMHLGIYLDFDVDYAGSGVWYDRAIWDNGNEWGYMWDSKIPPDHSAYAGFVGITEVDGGSVVLNPQYVYPSGMGWDDTVKYNFLSGTFAREIGDSSSDWSLIMVDGPFTLAPGASDTFVYAVLAGNDFDDFANNAEQARSHLLEALSIGKDAAGLPQSLSIKVSPNPFNSSCRIVVSTDVGAAFEARIHDLSGRCVASFTEKNSPEIIWEPAKNISSGVYFLDVQSRNRSLSRKIVLLR